MSTQNINKLYTKWSKPSALLTKAVNNVQIINTLNKLSKSSDSLYLERCDIQHTIKSSKKQVLKLKLAPAERKDRKAHFKYLSTSKRKLLSEVKSGGGAVKLKVDTVVFDLTSLDNDPETQLAIYDELMSQMCDIEERHVNAPATYTFIKIRHEATKSTRTRVLSNGRMITWIKHVLHLRNMEEPVIVPSDDALTEVDDDRLNLAIKVELGRALNDPNHKWHRAIRKNLDSVDVTDDTMKEIGKNFFVKSNKTKEVETLNRKKGE